MILDSTPLQLSVFGLTVLAEGQRPLLLLKDTSGELTLPVPLQPIEAGMTLSQTNTALKPSTPHKVTELLLRSIGVRITRCEFTGPAGPSPVVDLFLENHPRGETRLRVRAEEAMSLCLQLNVPIFASRAFILQSREAVALDQAEMQHLLKNPSALKRSHAYLM